jgi:hypothetical protein
MKTLRFWQRARAGDLVWIQCPRTRAFNLRGEVEPWETGKTVSRLGLEHRALVQVTRRSWRDRIARFFYH